MACSLLGAAVVVPDVARPMAKGWCPGAHRPMASGDGLIVRVRPRLARLTLHQALGLCEAAQEFGSGFIDLTSRANLQVRGVDETRHAALINRLCDLQLLDADPTLDTQPGILVTPWWVRGDDTERIGTALSARLADLPALPPKFGFTVDAGPAPVLCDASADVRIERGVSEGLIVRADGAAAGHPVSIAGAVDAALAVATWFAEAAQFAVPASTRMAGHLARYEMPDAWRPLETHAPPSALPRPGLSPCGPVYGVAFGQIDAAALAQLLQASGATALRLAPNRMLILEGGHGCDAPEFITTATDTLLLIDACSGAPSCAASSVDTRKLARALASALHPQARRRLHVSGCTKGCAQPRPADITLVGRNGAFDLVRNGRAWDRPSLSDLSPADVLSHIEAV